MRLQLETGTETLVETYKAVYKAFNAFRFAAEATERDPGSYGLTEMLEQLPTLETGVEKIIATAKTQLQELEKAI